MIDVGQARRVVDEVGLGRLNSLTQHRGVGNVAFGAGKKDKFPRVREVVVVVEMLD